MLSSLLSHFSIVFYDKSVHSARAAGQRSCGKKKKKGSSKRKTCGGEIERNADGVFGSVSVSVCCFQRLLMMFNLLIPTNS